MRTRILISTLLFLLLTLCAYISYSQVPKGFTYQAVIRDGAGNPIASRAVALRITLQDQAGTNPYYVETHQTTSNGQGVINLNIGNGTVVSGTFASIQWSTGSVYIKIEIDPNGGSTYTAMGAATKLQSVPYALYADNAKEVVSQPNAVDDDPIFVVKNKAGQIVFAVYQTGVRVYVEDTQITKGARGGFAVGGLTNQNKGQQEYFRITPDSARIYVKEAPTVKGARGGFAVGGLTNQNKAIVSRSMLFVAPDSTRIYVKDQAKGARGGFAVGGLTNQNKGSANQFLQLTPNNYFIGQNSGQSITTGIYNSTLGYQSGLRITSGESNAFVGYQSGYSNNTGSGNLFLGYKTGFSNEYGNYNSFLGYLAGNSNTSGTFNTFLGSFSGYHNTTGFNNTFVGDSTGFNNVNGFFNTFLGTGCGNKNSSGKDNVFIGFQSGYKNYDGFNNVFIGSSAGKLDESGKENVFIGTQSGYSSIDTWGNINIGYLSGFNTTTGSANTFVGARTGYYNTTGFSNTFIGIEAGYSMTTKCCNTFLGDHAGYYAKESESNVFLGAYAGYNSNQLIPVSKTNVFIGNAAGYSSIGGTSNVFIGFESGFENDISNNNVFLGYKSGHSNKTGESNVFIGSISGENNLTGVNNVFIGNNAGNKNTSGYENVCIGWFAGASNTTALGNVFLGSVAGEKNETGESNTFIGLHAGCVNKTGSSNTILGSWAADFYPLGDNNTLIGSGVSRRIKGSNNTIIGKTAGDQLVDGNGNVFLGYNAGYFETRSNHLYIENSNADSTSALIWGDFNKNLLRFNAQIGIGSNPIDDSNFSIGNPNGKAVLGIKGIGDPYNYSQIKLISDEGANSKYYEINHNKSNGFGIVYYDGTNWNSYLGIDSQGKMTIQNNSPLLNIYPNSGALGRKSTINLYGTFGPGTLTDYGSRSFAQIQAGCDDNQGWSGAYLRILGITPDGGSASELMRINTANGFVGIGTTSPDKNLHVVGDARITGSLYYGASPSSTVYSKPDYVFASDYENYIEPLKVEAFIKSNGHLPWMTSAKDEKDGVNLTRMQFETVETVENLQLQIIKQQSEIETLKSELAEIKALLKK